MTIVPFVSGRIIGIAQKYHICIFRNLFQYILLYPEILFFF